MMAHSVYVCATAVLLCLGGCRADRAPDPAPDSEPTERLTPLTEPDGLTPAEEEAHSQTDHVQRESERLTVRLQTGDEIVLEDVQEGSYERDRLHRYQGLLDEIGYHVVEVRMYEGGGYLLIRDTDGHQVFVDSPPVISPDRSRFVTTSMDLVAGYIPTAIRIYRLEPEGIENEWAYEATDWGPSDPRWINNHRIEFTQNYADPTGEITSTATGVLRYVGDDWVLEESS